MEACVGTMKNDEKINQEGNLPLDDPINNESFADKVIDYSDLFADSVFLGEIPFESIVEGITEQFSNYINMEDKTDYVDIFYTQYDTSKMAIIMDDSEEHPQELLEALEKLFDKFLDTIVDLFKLRLTITVIDEGETVDSESLEFRIRKLYEVFILNGRDNLKLAISKDMASRISASDITNDSEYFRIVDALIHSFYSPLISGFTPVQFIEYIGDDDLMTLFNEGEITGNFLRKYSPKLYQNDEFRCELINDFILIQQVGKEITNGGQQ